MSVLGELRDEGGTLLFRAFTSSSAACQGAYYTHHHVYYELSLITGSGRYLSGGYSGKHYDVSPGSLFFYKNSEPHCITDITSPAMDFLNVYISPLYFRHLTGGAFGDFGIEFLQKSFPSNRLADFLDEDELATVRDAMHRISAELREGKDSALLMAKNHLDRALITLARKSLPSEGLLPTRGRFERIFEVLSYINEHYREPLSLSELATACNLEKTYFSALFKRVIGLSPCEYITVRRIEHAVKLLKATDKSVLEIATECGFNNTANFNKLFKNHTGTVPKAIRAAR